jgi:hypothetical protein
MEMNIVISDYKFEREVKNLITDKIDKEINQKLQDILKTINVEDLIQKRIDYFVDKSKYVSNDIIRNLVQQKIAREITDKVFPKS